MNPLSSSYQPTLLSASVSGLVILWLITFAGEIYGDLNEVQRVHLFRGIGWIVPVFAVNCVNLAIQYSFETGLKGRECAMINVFAAVSTFYSLIASALEIRTVLMPPGYDAGFMDMQVMLAALLSGWTIIILLIIIFSLRRARSRGEKNG